MRRVLVIALALASAAALAVLATGASSGGGGYKVRAIFENAFALVQGEDVKVAGVKVGSIESLDVTPDQKAAVVLDITRPGFDDFRKDAECTIRPQGLIGERFVECTLTQPHPVGQNPPPALAVIPNGRPGAGQHLLPVTNTSRPVDIDLVNNIMRLPFRQRLGILINEFGTGLASRGQDLRSVIRNADPGLKATDRVLNLLAGQDKVLADLAKQSDIALAPLARERVHVQGFVVHAAQLATATAQKQPAFKAQFDKLPAFLGQLRPTMARLSSFADQATPVLANLHQVAPQVSRFIKALGPFSSSATVSLKSLGQATIPGRKALVAAKGIVGDLRSFAKSAKPLARGLAGLTTSFKATGGVERLLDYIFYQVAAINGYDSFGHYLRASLILNLCTQYATETSKQAACSSNFQKPIGTSASSRTLTAMQVLHEPGLSLTTRRTGAVLRGMSPAEAIRLTGGAKATDNASTQTPLPKKTRSSSSSASTSTSSAPAATQAAPTPSSSTTGNPSAGTAQQLLDYLLGGGA
jgi:phospholipid/cholesterol/gamma-HCH transport system substrate-binding protein